MVQNKDMWNGVFAIIIGIVIVGSGSSLELGDISWVPKVIGGVLIIAGIIKFAKDITR